MIIDAARLAAKELLAPKFRTVLFKSLGLTIVLFIAMWILVEGLISSFLTPLLGPWPWVSTAVVWLMGAGMFVGAGFLIAPVTAIFAGVFLDDIANHVERKHYPHEGIGQPIPMAQSIWLAVKFTGVVIAANLFALMLVLLPGINFAIFFLVNGYLVGREYFQFAAMRFRQEGEAASIRKVHSGTVFMAGLVIAGFMAVPILNLATPMFAAAMMTHLHKMLSGSTPKSLHVGAQVRA